MIKQFKMAVDPHLCFPNHPRSPRDYKKLHVFLVYKLQNRSTEYVEYLMCVLL